MKKIVLLNESKIEKFDIKYYKEQKKYQIVAALSALETTNELQQSFIKNSQNTNLDSKDYILNLYALLQGLFVSIDSLYALAFALTKSKNFININNNKNLRQLKYIRNDVVGHPSNRVLNDTVIAYCILDNSSVTNNSFSYDIYTLNGVDRKTINIQDILVSYYNESNKLLDELYKISLDGINSEELSLSISKVLDVYYHQGDYLSFYNKFVDEYNSKYTDSNHRINWRIDMINEMLLFKPSNQDEIELIKHCIGLELQRIYEFVNNTKYKVDIISKLPKYVQAFYKFLNKNKDMYDYLIYLKDVDHPMFKKSLIELKNKATLKNANDALKYIILLLSILDSGNIKLVYALKNIIREYKQK